MKIANGMQFVNDEAVIGKWNNIGWIENTYCTSKSIVRISKV